MKSILVVEDNRPMGRLVSRAIEEKLNMPVLCTASFEETRQLLSSTDPETFFAAVLDFVLPDAMNGEIIDLVIKKRIPSIVFTAGISEAVRKFVWSKKVVDYILKDDPRSLDSLVEVLKRMTTNTRSKILVVDDAQFFRKVISELLYSHQYKIITANSGEDALRALQAHPDIKLVITDFHMKGMNGIELCQKIRETRSKGDLAVIGISTEGNPAMAAQFIKSGANDFIIKQSFIMEEFYCRINQSLDFVDLIHRTKEAAIKDYLTGLYNRRYFFSKGRKVFREFEDKPGCIACVMLDIDWFKQVNDTHGHDAGDKVLIGLADIFSQASGDGDIPARLGGEEFCILVTVTGSGPNPGNIIRERFETLRQTIQETAFDIGGPTPLSITVSMGISDNSSQDFDTMLKQADERLYKAKDGGRNRIVLPD